MYHLDVYGTLVAATLVLLLGRKLVKSVPFLEKYTIPEPVAGGLLVAFSLLLLKQLFDWSLSFDLSLQEPMMLAFLPQLVLMLTLLV